MSQVDRVAGSLNTSKRTHTHICTQSVLLARQQPHRNIPVGAGQTPPPIVCPDGAKAQSVVLEVRWGHKKVKKKKRGKKKKEIGGEGRHVTVKRKRRKVRQYEAEM